MVLPAVLSGKFDTTVCRGLTSSLTNSSGPARDFLVRRKLVKLARGRGSGVPVVSAFTTVASADQKGPRILIWFKIGNRNMVRPQFFGSLGCRVTRSAALAPNGAALPRRARMVKSPFRLARSREAR